MQIDNATFLQKKAYASALSIILTLRVPEVIDKLEDILRYSSNQRNDFSCMYYIIRILWCLFFACSVCTTVILGDNKETSGEDSRCNPFQNIPQFLYLLCIFFQLGLASTFLIHSKLLAMVAVQAPRVPLDLAMIVLDMVVFQARN